MENDKIFKSIGIVNGKPKTIYEDEKGNKIEKPTKIQIKLATKKPYVRNKITKIYNEKNTCDICRREGKITKLYTGNAYNKHDKDGKQTREWICNNCYAKNYQKNNPNSQHNIIKSVTNRRIGYQNPNCNQVFSDKCEELTNRWKGVESLSIKYDNYKLPLDHTIDSEGIIYQTKGRCYYSLRNMWNQNWINEHGKNYNFLIFYCFDKNGEHLERVYVFPKDIVEDITGVAIVDYNSKGVLHSGWYDQYRIDNEDILNLLNNIWNKILEEK